jgi:hypothetical protein
MARSKMHARGKRQYRKPLVRKGKKLAEVTEGTLIPVTGGSLPL